MRGKGQQSSRLPLSGLGLGAVAETEAASKEG
jgi:hypothetical protein